MKSQTSDYSGTLCGVGVGRGTYRRSSRDGYRRGTGIGCDTIIRTQTQPGDVKNAVRGRRECWVRFPWAAAREPIGRPVNKSGSDAPIGGCAPPSPLPAPPPFATRGGRAGGGRGGAGGGERGGGGGGGGGGGVGSPSPRPSAECAGLRVRRASRSASVRSTAA
ncbi:unnamed protein product, partial [Iphiclides podalirius]